MKAVIRPMKFMDLKGVCALNEITLPENYPLMFWEDMFNKGAKKYSHVLVISGDITGYIFCDGVSIVSFSVHEKYRNKGLGKQLMMHCLSSAIGRKLTLHVRLGNTNAIKMYLCFGFKLDKVIPDYYTTLQEDAYEMTLNVPNNVKYNLKNKFNLNLM